MLLSLLTTPVNAFEPLTLLTGIISPIFCKIIGCRTIENKYLFVEYPKKNQERVKELRDNFKWGGYHENGDCTDYYQEDIDKHGTVCYSEGKWVIAK